jgi:NTP pyrophosphatase (non-canonical NTP hydrolase)
LKLDEYQNQAASSLSADVVDQISHLTYGLLAEAGEVATIFQKAMRKDKRYYAGHDGSSILSDTAASKLFLELGDVLWHVAVLGKECGWSLETIAVGNLSKLTDRALSGTIKGDGDHR